MHFKLTNTIMATQASPPSAVQQAANKMMEEGKKVLTLIIKQKYFDEILAGTKTKEYREIKYTTLRKLVQTDGGDGVLLDENENPIPLHYDALLLFVGYRPDRDSALVEVLGAENERFKDENGEDIFVVDEYGKFYPSQIAYSLGRVIEKDVRSKK